MHFYGTPKWPKMAPKTKKKSNVLRISYNKQKRFLWQIQQVFLVSEYLFTTFWQVSFPNNSLKSTEATDFFGFENDEPFQEYRGKSLQFTIIKISFQVLAIKSCIFCLSKMFLAHKIYLLIVDKHPIFWYVDFWGEFFKYQPFLQLPKLGNKLEESLLWRRFCLTHESRLWVRTNQ